jgi:hypothetical protein
MFALSSSAAAVAAGEEHPQGLKASSCACLVIIHARNRLVPNTAQSLSLSSSFACPSLGIFFVVLNC